MGRPDWVWQSGVLVPTMESWNGLDIMLEIKRLLGCEWFPDIYAFWSKSWRFYEAAKEDKPHLPSGKHGSGNTKSSCLTEQINCLGSQSTFPQNFQGNSQYFLATPRGLLCQNLKQNHKAHFMHQWHLAVVNKQPLRDTDGLRNLVMGLTGFYILL